MFIRINIHVYRLKIIDFSQPKGNFCTPDGILMKLHMHRITLWSYISWISIYCLLIDGWGQENLLTFWRAITLLLPRKSWKKNHVHYHIMVTYTQNIIYKIWSIAHSVMAEDVLSLVLSNQRAITHLVLKISWQNFLCTTTIWSYTQHKFNKIPSIAYKVMDEDGKHIQI